MEKDKGKERQQVIRNGTHSTSLIAAENNNRMKYKYRTGKCNSWRHKAEIWSGENMETEWKQKGPLKCYRRILF